MEQRTILVVDDDVELRQQISAYLADSDFRVFAAGDSKRMDEILAAQDIDVIVLDLSLPGEDGLSICRRLERSNGPGILMASAAGTETDRVLGLELGADDYLPKPFSPRELLARIRAMIRRRDALMAGSARRSQILRFEGFVFDTIKKQLRSPTGALIMLTLAEASFLNLLLTEPDIVWTREALSTVEATSRGPDILVSRLRKKLEAYGGRNFIRTERGAGYQLDCTVIRQ